MSWDQRPYYREHEPASGGGLGSWFGGMPSPGRAVKWICIANIAMFLLCLLTGGVQSPVYEALEMRTDLVLRGQVWRIVSFTYLHDQSGLWHILFNMLGLYLLGVALEQRLGSRRFFWFYSTAGLVAGLMFLLVTATHWLSPRTALVGASGGVLGVLGACAVLLPHMRIVLVFFLVPIRTAALILGAFFLFNLLTHGANAGGEACHLAGMGFGIWYGYRGHNWSLGVQRLRGDLRRRAEETRIRAEREELARVDEILEKVHREGIGSLSRREKQTLEAASRKNGRR